MGHSTGTWPVVVHKWPMLVAHARSSYFELKTPAAVLDYRLPRGWPVTVSYRRDGPELLSGRARSRLPGNKRGHHRRAARPGTGWQAMVLGGDFTSAAGGGLTLPCLYIYAHRVRDLSYGAADLVVATIALASLAGNPRAARRPTGGRRGGR